jgi:hypothetical protein
VKTILFSEVSFVGGWLDGNMIEKFSTVEVDTCKFSGYEVVFFLPSFPFFDWYSSWITTL